MVQVKSRHGSNAVRGLSTSQSVVTCRQAPCGKGFLSSTNCRQNPLPQRVLARLAGSVSVVSLGVQVASNGRLKWVSRPFTVCDKKSQICALFFVETAEFDGRLKPSTGIPKMTKSSEKVSELSLLALFYDFRHFRDSRRRFCVSPKFREKV